jgi:hypothetical protein
MFIFMAKRHLENENGVSDDLIMEFLVCSVVVCLLLSTI